MTFVFLHHEVHGPVSLDALWEGRHGLGGSVARLRILFWLAARGHKVYLIGRVHDGILRGVEAIAGTTCLYRRFACGTSRDVLVLNNPPEEDEWRRLGALN